MNEQKREKIRNFLSPVCGANPPLLDEMKGVRRNITIPRGNYEGSHV
jgi:hypothetical protein